jgi:hypothetical protein
MKSASLNWAVARVFPFRSLTERIGVRTTMPSAPREYPISTGTTALSCRPYKGSTSTVVTEAAIRPLFRPDQLSSSDSVRRTLNPCFLKKMLSSLGSRPLFAAMMPA